MFQKLSKKYKLGIATNAIQSTLDLTLKKLKIKKFIKAAISTKNLKNPKPHPEIYLRCLLELNSIPRQTLILEDSHYGRMAAKDSGCKLLPVNIPVHKLFIEVLLSIFINLLPSVNKTIKVSPSCTLICSTHCFKFI